MDKIIGRSTERRVDKPITNIVCLWPSYPPGLPLSEHVKELSDSIADNLADVFFHGHRHDGMPRSCKWDHAVFHPKPWKETQVSWNYLVHGYRIHTGVFRNTYISGWCWAYFWERGEFHSHISMTFKNDRYDRNQDIYTLLVLLLPVELVRNLCLCGPEGSCDVVSHRPQKNLRSQEIDGCECNTACCRHWCVGEPGQATWQEWAANFPDRKRPSIHGRSGNAGCNPPRQKIHMNHQDVLLYLPYLFLKKWPPNVSEKPRMFALSVSERSPATIFCLAYILCQTVIQKLSSWTDISPVIIRNCDHHLATPDHHPATHSHRHHQLQ